MLLAEDGTFLVGSIKATDRPETAGDPALNDKLPAAIKLISLNMNFNRGTEDEFGAAMPAYEEKIAELERLGCDLIRPGGAPPFMLLGYDGESLVIDGWMAKYGVDIFTSGQNHVRALRALKIHRFVGASYFPPKLNTVFANYFKDAEFQVLSMEGIKVEFKEVPKLPPQQIFDHIKKLLDANPTAQGIYMLGSAWRSLDLVERLERELSLPVVHPMPARNWETQLRLGFREPVPGYGKLLAEMIDD
jgi:maleate isomerase